MATRDPGNLKSDLKEMAVGETLELESFGFGKDDYQPRRLLIEKLDKESYSVTSFDYGDYEEDEDGEPLEPFPIENVSNPMGLKEVVASVGEFAY